MVIHEAIPMGLRTGKLLGMRSYGWAFQLVILIAFVAVVYWVFHGMKKNNSAMELLKKRYVAGEISKKEFLKIKKEIS